MTSWNGFINKYVAVGTSLSLNYYGNVYPFEDKPSEMSDADSDSNCSNVAKKSDDDDEQLEYEMTKAIIDHQVETIIKENNMDAEEVAGDTIPNEPTMASKTTLARKRKGRPRKNSQKNGRNAPRAKKVPTKTPPKVVKTIAQSNTQVAKPIKAARQIKPIKPRPEPVRRSLRLVIRNTLTQVKIKTPETEAITGFEEPDYQVTQEDETKSLTKSFGILDTKLSAEIDTYKEDFDDSTSTTCSESEFGGELRYRNNNGSGIEFVPGDL